tara:strand:+ start:8306 stop:10546 length:2241 start_codon:yes stop_codon:yes gene_type:complete
MITRSQMRRQLRAQGGIMNVAPRKKFGLGSKLKERFRKLIPNELADVAVKAAPFVAPFNPGIAGLMRGIGRFDQRGSISDALKQGLATTAFGAGARYLGGAENIMGGGLKGGFTNPIGQDSSLRNLFAEKNTVLTKDQIKNEAKKKASGNRFMDDIIGQTTGKIPGVKSLPQIVQEKLLVGGVTSGATYLYEKFLADEPPQNKDETYEQYMARRKENVGRKMRTYMDNYFANEPEYMQLDDAGRDAFVARYNVRDGGRIGYQTGGVTMGSTLQQNIASNRQQAAGIQAMLNAARTKAGLPTVQAPQRTTQSGISSLSTPAQTSAPAQASAPAPSITTPSSTPTQTQAPTMQQISSAMLSGGNPMASPTASSMVSPAQQTTQPLKQYTIPEQSGPGMGPMGPMMADPLQVFSGLNQQQLGELPEQDFLALEKRFDALPQSEKDNIDKFITTSMDKQAQQFLSKEKADEIKYRQPDGSAGNMGMYVDAVEGLKATRPDIKLTGNETFTELQKIIYPEYFNPDGSYMTDDQYNQEFNPSSLSGKPYQPEVNPYYNADGTVKEEFDPMNNFIMLDAAEPSATGTYLDRTTGYSIPQTSSGYEPNFFYKTGGRVGFEEGGTNFMKWLKANYGLEVKELDMDQYSKLSREYNNENSDPYETGRKKNAGGGIMSMPMGQPRVNQGGVTELDYRAKGGFVPVGIKEKADDVPAMLSKNEFVFTADAVRGAGNGSIEKGAQKMYDTMKNLERRVT